MRLESRKSKSRLNPVSGCIASYFLGSGAFFETTDGAGFAAFAGCAAVVGFADAAGFLVVLLTIVFDAGATGLGDATFTALGATTALSLTTLATFSALGADFFNFSSNLAIFFAVLAISFLMYLV
jgi:hypothetical protein